MMEILLSRAPWKRLVGGTMIPSVLHLEVCKELVIYSDDVWKLQMFILELRDQHSMHHFLCPHLLFFFQVLITIGKT